MPPDTKSSLQPEANLQDPLCAHPIIFYDGVCGLCDGLVQFVMRRDRAGIFRFAPLQGAIAAQILPAHGKNPGDLESLYVLAGGRVRERADAVLHVLRLLGLPCSALSVIGLLPRPVLDLGYRLVARYRYRLFGRYEACPLPDPQLRDRFLQ